MFSLMHPPHPHPPPPPPPPPLLPVTDAARGVGVGGCGAERVFKTEAPVKGPVIGCRLHRAQQMEWRGAACILQVYGELRG